MLLCYHPQDNMNELVCVKISSTIFIFVGVICVLLFFLIYLKTIKIKTTYTVMERITIVIATAYDPKDTEVFSTTRYDWTKDEWEDLSLLAKNRAISYNSITNKLLNDLREKCKNNVNDQTLVIYCAAEA